MISSYMNALFFLINSIGLGIGLAMDAFSVSLANGLNEPRMNKKRSLFISGIYATFQFLMPLIGWFFVHTAAAFFSVLRPLIPWIALVLLAIIGGKMLLEARSGSDSESGPTGVPLTRKVLLLQGIATSIDALSVGLTIADYHVVSAIIASLIIGIVTLVICLAGLRLGRTFGTRLSGRASILGGIILLAIGLEIWIKGVFF